MRGRFAPGHRRCSLNRPPTCLDLGRQVAILVLLAQFEQVFGEPNAFFLPFAFVGEEANVDVSVVDDMKSVDHVGEAELGRGVEQFLLLDPTRIEISASVEESARFRCCLFVRKLEMFADVTSEWFGEVVESDDLFTLLGKFK